MRADTPGHARTSFDTTLITATSNGVQASTKWVEHVHDEIGGLRKW
jgi:hypothetical protein